MIVYFDINEAVLRNVLPNSTVLEIGCGTGALGEQLELKGCKVTGIDNNKEALETAKNKINKTILLDIQDKTLELKEKYDYIIIADVLEHLIDPEETLKSFLQFLKPEGKVIVSLPNIANWTIRLKLLFGSFKRTETGILDKTHLHFYTLKTAKELAKNLGLSIVHIDVTPNFVRAFLPVIKKIAVLFGIKGQKGEINKQLLESKTYKFYRKAILPIETVIAKTRKNLFAYQIILVCKNK